MPAVGGQVAERTDALREAVQTYLEARILWRDREDRAAWDACQRALAAIRERLVRVASRYGMEEPPRLLMAHDAEDVASVVVTKFWAAIEASLASPDGAGVPLDPNCWTGWLYTVTRNAVYDLLRKLQVRRKRGLESSIPISDMEPLLLDPATEQPNGNPDDAAIDDWRASLLVALDAAHAILCETSRRRDLDSRRWVFVCRRIERMDGATIRARAVADGHSAYQDINDNRIDQHATRYRKDLGMVIRSGALDPKHAAMLGNLLAQTGITT